jgi:hypothetical protein
MLSGDWYYEIVRERLTEIYDRKTVDEMLPFQAEHYYNFNKNYTTIDDSDLEKIGQFKKDNGKNLY